MAGFFKKDSLDVIRDWLVRQFSLSRDDMLSLDECDLSENEAREVRDVREIPALVAVKYLQKKGLLSKVYDGITPYNPSNGDEMRDYLTGEARWFERAVELLCHDYRIKHGVSEVPEAVRKKISERAKSAPILHRRWRVFYTLHRMVLNQDISYAHAPKRKMNGEKTFCLSGAVMAA